jgi:hypothetical protein
MGMTADIYIAFEVIGGDVVIDLATLRAAIMHQRDLFTAAADDPEQSRERQLGAAAGVEIVLGWLDDIDQDPRARRSSEQSPQEAPPRGSRAGS